MVYDSMNFESAKENLLGTTGGIISFLVMGLITSCCLNEFYDKTKSGLIQKYSPLLVNLYIVAILILNILNFNNFLMGVRTDIFLIEEQSGFYQRAANFMILQQIISGSLIYVLSLHSRNNSRVGIYIALAIYFISTLVLCLTSQLIGSNAGFVCVFGYFLIVILALKIASERRIEFPSKKIRFKDFFVGWIAKKVLATFSIIILSMLFFAFIFLNFYSFDFSIFRIAGFGDGNLSSASSRIEIFMNNFTTHILYNPLLGNTLVDSLTTGDGTYIHSLLSVVTHLGLMGFILFIAFISMIVRSAIYSQHRLSKDLTDNMDYLIFRMMSMIFISIVCLLIAFYTWAPFWFVIGLMGFNKK
jgi:hypothetical protein